MTESATYEQSVDQPVEVAPLPDNIMSVQPGGGYVYSLELAWGRWRRWWLKRFRHGYVERMAAKMTGSAEGAPHEILDPRDLKYCRNLCTARWAVEDDPFRWREQIPLARWGLAETFCMSLPLIVLMVLPAILWPQFWWTGLVVLPVLYWVFYFFRDPARVIPCDPEAVVAPADGKIAEIVKLDHHEFIGGPAVRIGIFLSIFNVHINRSPGSVQAVKLHYSPGLFLNALDPESAIKNENMWIGLQETAPPHRRMVVRQIAGLFARRIVCQIRPGEELDRGEKFGMIKLGSRTELILPDEPGLTIEVAVGQKIQAGATVMARFASADAAQQDSAAADE